MKCTYRFGYKLDFNLKVVMFSSLLLKILRAMAPMYNFSKALRKFIEVIIWVGLKATILEHFNTLFEKVRAVKLSKLYRCVRKLYSANSDGDRGELTESYQR